MNLKKIFLILLIFFLPCAAIGYVFGNEYLFPPEIHAWGVVSSVRLWSPFLDSTIIAYKTNWSITDYEIISECSIDYQYLDRKKEVYFFKLQFLEDNCNDSTLHLALNSEFVPGSEKIITFEKVADLFDIYLDYSTQDLENLKESIQKSMQAYWIYANYNLWNIAENYKYYLSQRKFYEAKYAYDIIEEILIWRWKKYISPVPWRHIDTQANKVPNAGRPYRAWYTDGIHRWWDIDAELGDEVVALDDGIIVRVVDNFNNETDFSKIQYWDNLDAQIQNNNLDILRGNQVWLKTMKWEVVFYSHLQTISDGIIPGLRVSTWQKLWTIWVTGVPGKAYDDYHLHFAIMQNPYNSIVAGTYTFDDYMSWDWKARNLSYDEVILLQKTIFKFE